MKQILLLFVALLLLNCHPTSGPGSTARLSSFKGIPPEASGCTCYFAADEQRFRNEQFVFVSDLDSLAYISINDKPVTLKLVSSTRQPDSHDQYDYTNTYANGLYRLEIDIHFTEQTGDEVWWNTARIRLYFKELLVDQKTCQGECGC
jgi:hypothetical protein